MTVEPVSAPKRAYRRKSADAAPCSAEPQSKTPKVRKPRASRALGFVAEPLREPGKAPTGKLAILVGLMQRTEGATLAAMGKATGWQAHSVRGALSGALRKKHRLIITTEAAEGVRTYRLPAGQGAPATGDGLKVAGGADDA
ncbi:DUF3489 domain-containing protein [Brevundimonas sp. DC300-4]|uniref:DUF3489 domain-containing protein n=1 Tax=Brevundimonas sp. DC300-4 TaxID=2804594 RepID=UPI003CE8FDBA